MSEFYKERYGESRPMTKEEYERFITAIERKENGNNMMHELKDILVWKTNDGAITITSCLDTLILAKILNHKVEWINKELCCADVVDYIEKKA